MLDILTRHYKETLNDRAINLEMTTGDLATKFLQLSMSDMYLDQDEYRVATFSDVTESKTLARVEQQNSLLTMLQSSVSHELMTPLRCIVNFAQILERELKHSPR